MAVKVGINGFGRIGRLVMRAALESQRKDIEFVAINDLGSADMNAHMLSFDSAHGRFGVEVQHGSDWIDAGRGRVKVLAERDPSQLPWGELGVDVVMECTGLFASRDRAAAHLAAGARRVLVSAPCTEADMTVVYGVNHQAITDAHTVISNASCTTNCLVPVAHVLHQGLGIDSGMMTTVHAVTGDQLTVDSLHKDPWRARSALANMIPTSTGAARAVGLVLPELKGKLDGTSVRVPLPNVSMVDLTFNTGIRTSQEEVNDLCRQAAEGPLKGILAINDKPLTSMDFNHHPASSIFDTTQTQIMTTDWGTMVRILSWYDNEWGFSNRMSDVAAHIGQG